MAGKLDQIIVIDIEAPCWEEQEVENDASKIIAISICSEHQEPVRAGIQAGVRGESSESARAL